MESKPHVILIAGPAGSGKTSTAGRIAEHPDWVHVSEDVHWDKVKAGRPRGEARTSEEQKIVQEDVAAHVRDLLSQNKRVALEFILYEDPPLPLLNYQKILGDEGVPYATSVLRPEVGEVLRRIESRGRDTHTSLEALKGFAEHQIRCLYSPHILDEWVIDSTNISLEELYQKHFKHLVEND